MTNQVRKTIQKIEEPPQEEQEKIAKLILEELSWDRTFDTSQETLSGLAKEANEEYHSGETSDQV